MVRGLHIRQARLALFRAVLAAPAAAAQAPLLVAQETLQVYRRRRVIMAEALTIRLRIMALAVAAAHLQPALRELQR